MPIPHFSEIRKEIMDRLSQLGGQGETSEIHDYLLLKWGLTSQEQSLRDSRGGIHYKKQIDGAIAQLKKARQITHPQRGLLRLTTRVAELIPTIPPEHKTDKNVPESYHDQICEMLYEIGQMEKKISEKEYRINGERIDVAWKNIRTGDPSHVLKFR